MGTLVLLSLSVGLAPSELMSVLDVDVAEEDTMVVLDTVAAVVVAVVAVVFASVRSSLLSVQLACVNPNN